MRLVSYDAGAGPRAGLLRDDRVHDVWGEARTVEAVLDASEPAGSRSSEAQDEGLPLDGSAPAAPRRRRPGKIICIGLNYRSHCEEQGIEPPETATFFAKFANALTPPGRHRGAAALEQQGGLRGRGGVRDRQARQGRARGAGARPRGRLHAVQRPVGARLPVQDAAVDAGQDLRRRRSLRTGARERRRGRAPRRHRDRAAAERRGHAAGHHRRPGALGARRSWPTCRSS